uniref:Uncharacterized protein n=1 Tax=Aegilops tauschii subsp. strangulata TaxID=200361 RepID=A0A453BYA1_AEGTS
CNLSLWPCIRERRKYKLYESTHTQCHIQNHNNDEHVISFNQELSFTFRPLIKLLRSLHEIKEHMRLAPTPTNHSFVRARNILNHILY